MKNTRIDFTKGINEIGDKAIIAEGLLTIADNVDLRSGSARSFRAPVRVGGTTPPSDAVQLFVYRGKFYYSSVRRHYATDYFGATDRVYFSQYAGKPQKIIEGTQVDLGTPAPIVSPAVIKGTALGVNNVTVTEQLGTGNLTIGTRVSIRVGVRTKDGVMPASNKAVVVIQHNNSSVVVAWSPPAQSVGAKAIVIFGPDEDKEQRITDVGVAETSYTYSGQVGAKGELASSYDQNFNMEYVYTFLRRVNGVDDESGPSPASVSVLSSQGRQITFDPVSDGAFGFSTLQSGPWTASTLSLAPSSTLGPDISLTAWAYDSSVGRLKFTTAAPHLLVNGERLLFDASFTDVLWENVVKDIYTDPAYPNNFWTDDLIAPTDAPGGGQKTRRGVTATIALCSYDSGVVGTKFTTTANHGYKTGDKLIFQAFSDSVWNNQTFEIVASPTNLRVFWVTGVSFPTDASFASQQANRAATSLTMPVSLTPPMDGDTIYLSITDNASPAHVFTGYYRALVINNSSILLPFFVDTNGAHVAYNWSGTFSGSVTQTIEWVPNNGYLWARRLYRTGDSDQFLLVKEIPMETTVFKDSTPTANLGAPPDSFYVENNQVVIFDVAPLGAEGLIAHHGMGFCIDDHSVRWTPVGRPDAWPQTFRLDFAYKPVALASYQGAMIVLCEDAIYRIDGQTPTTLSRTPTSCFDGCIAPNSVQKVGNDLFYLSRRGVIQFSQGRGICITDSKLRPQTLLSPSGFAGISQPAFWWLRTEEEALYYALAENDGVPWPVNGPRYLGETRQIGGINRAIRSFYYLGKYHLYWSAAETGYDAHSMICIDMQMPGMPVTTLGFKPLDVHVADTGEAYCLLQDVNFQTIGAYVANPGNSPCRQAIAGSSENQIFVIDNNGITSNKALFQVDVNSGNEILASDTGIPIANASGSDFLAVGRSQTYYLNPRTNYTNGAYMILRRSGFTFLTVANEATWKAYMADYGYPYATYTVSVQGVTVDDSGTLYFGYEAVKIADSSTSYGVVTITAAGVWTNFALGAAPGGGTYAVMQWQGTWFTPASRSGEFFVGNLADGVAATTFYSVFFTGTGFVVKKSTGWPATYSGTNSSLSCNFNNQSTGYIVLLDGSSKPILFTTNGTGTFTLATGGTFPDDGIGFYYVRFDTDASPTFLGLHGSTLEAYKYSNAALVNQIAHGSPQTYKGQKFLGSIQNQLHSLDFTADGILIAVSCNAH